MRLRIAALEGISARMLSLCAGVSSFVLTLLAFLLVKELDAKIAASIGLGFFALLLVWVALEKPNSGQARAVSALIERLLAVKSGDLSSPAPALVAREHPELAAAVDGLFEQVRATIDNVNAMAMYDPVTSLPNRVHFRREAERMLKARKAGERVALLFIDLDGFKEVNDNLGHAQGDHVLMMVADRLRALVKSEADRRNTPLVARLAGDEFTLLFSGIESVEEAERIARLAASSISEPMAMAAQNVHLGAAVGIAMCPAHGMDLASLMKAADIAMYHAKSIGRSQVARYDRDMALAFEERSRTEKALRQALERNEFLLEFQPQLCARTGAVVGGEALIRWNDPVAGLRQPDSFIGLAEENSLIVEIGDWVVNQVAAALARWQAAGLQQRLAFNVSPKQIERADFGPRLIAALEAAGADPHGLEIELTETLAMQSSEPLLAGLFDLKAKGVSIAIDDFGSGYSNLARMKSLPVDRVKLDRALVADITTSSGTREVISAVVHLIHGLGCEAIAEGAEQEEQIDLLRTIGCDVIQGFAYSEAMPEEAFIEWVRQRSKGLRLVHSA